ncbi:translocase [Oceanicola granulosus HTCC2516]|uniref:Protein translocase subunit SecA n=1 Tax=Oceanicola granulosus (strain ATCC BAA-861 / DSM 15982 / KCTC 12143 / HTCC2516) TaxID=314256 RepID=Q2CEY2_OCEGH|nr:translocase [Oceanicola granulosus]EAR51228.1 translocase [Oceanicola granulosus HTCC2516]
MPDGGRLGFGAPRRAVSPYAERADPIDNAVDRIAERWLGWAEARWPLHRRRLARRAARIAALEPRYAALRSHQLVALAHTLARQTLRHTPGRDPLAHLLAVLAELLFRTLGKRPYPVQLMGAMALLEGRLVEMATGEGKTITGMPAALAAALRGEPVHVVTVNDYLAGRDGAEIAPLAERLGLSVGIVETEMDPAARAAAYACDLTYVSNANVTFDYLRDRVALGQARGPARARLASLIGGRAGAGLTLRGLGFAIVDEADSVFIDEARTPLILSSSGDEADAARLYNTGLRLARALRAGADFELDEMRRSVTLTEAGKERLAAEAAGLDGQWRVRLAREELVVQALSALHLFELGRDYIVDDGGVQIVDEYSGRVMPDRTWQGGLHQMIEAKEGVEVTGRKVTLASITYQRFFRRYVRLAGMTGTGMELAGEFRETYGLVTVRIPRHRPLRRRHVGSRFFQTAAGRWRAVAARVGQLAAQGRPVLIGTRSVEASEHLSRVLDEAGLAHRVLNARSDEAEADIVAAAGQRGAVTVATNVAGRGTDIALGEGVRELGGLHVILTEYHESSRIDRQLYGRAGRQGDPGTTEAIVSREDELFTRYTPRLLRLARAARMPLLDTLMRRTAQSRAEREHAITRREQVRLDKQLESSMAFAGQRE